MTQWKDYNLEMIVFGPPNQTLVTKDLSAMSTSVKQY